AARYRAIYGHAPEAREVEVESLRVVASSRATEAAPVPRPPEQEATPAGTAEAWLAGGRRKVPCFERERLAPGDCLRGPALVWERHSATVVEGGWEARVDGAGALVLNREADSPSSGGATRAFAVKAVREELFIHR